MAHALGPDRDKYIATTIATIMFRFTWIIDGTLQVASQSVMSCISCKWNLYHHNIYMRLGKLPCCNEICTGFTVFNDFWNTPWWHFDLNFTWYAWSWVSSHESRDRVHFIFLCCTHLYLLLTFLLSSSLFLLNS